MESWIIKMKNIKNYSITQKRTTLIVVAIVTILLIISFAFYIINTSTKKSSDTTNEPPIGKETDNANGSGNNDNNSVPEAVNPDTTKDSYVSGPITQPSINEPFPIENEHYKIVQNSETKYTATLYPIVNNPDYIDYPSQLKAYKKEVMDYLSKRFADVSKLSINWIPDEATNL